MHPSLRLFAIVCLAVASAVANDTSLHEGRWGPEPIGGTDGPESPVRMVREELRVEFGKETTDVEAKFTFCNTQAGPPVQQLVGFPDLGAADDEQLRRDREKDPKASFEGVNSTGPLLRMKTFVNGKPCPSELRYGAIALDKNSFPLPWRNRKGETTRLMAWHAVEVAFPAGEEVTIERRYRVKNGWQIYNIAFFSYTTATGGVWQGTIGQMTADVFLQDGLKVGDLAWDDSTLPKHQRGGILMEPPSRRAWQVVSPTHVRLTWKDFEPRTEVEHRGFTVARKSPWKPKPGQEDQ
ncbi:MAG: hypothetical protein QOE70_4605 [Chthoniobacter sp.]|jgi:hypothetical protein|nr:hypothetical protein [Chthoniobacter sp.]